MTAEQPPKEGFHGHAPEQSPRRVAALNRAAGPAVGGGRLEGALALSGNSMKPA